jgi:hypothetical protein
VGFASEGDVNRQAVNNRFNPEENREPGFNDFSYYCSIKHLLCEISLSRRLISGCGEKLFRVFLGEGQGIGSS